MQRIFSALLIAVFVSTVVSCKKENKSNNTGSGNTAAVPQLIFKFDFDSTQARLNNLGQPTSVPSGHAAQSPLFRKISAHYVEMTTGPLVALGAGSVLYKAPETTAGGANAIDFAQSRMVAEGETFLSVPLSSVSPGSYPYLRVSLAYQNYNVRMLSNGQHLTGTIASFVGYNTYIGQYTINTQPVTVNANKLQGYWGFETTVLGTPYVVTGQAPAGATTVPNPLFSTSPIPAGSCVVTGQFAQPLVITGNETGDVVVTVHLSTNKSFEWVEVNADGEYEPTAGETVVDMGLRGLIPTWQ
jgi:hypothetical protein